MNKPKSFWNGKFERFKTPNCLQSYVNNFRVAIEIFNTLAVVMEKWAIHNLGVVMYAFPETTVQLLNPSG